MVALARVSPSASSDFLTSPAPAEPWPASAGHRYTGYPDGPSAVKGRDQGESRRDPGQSCWAHRDQARRWHG